MLELGDLDLGYLALFVGFAFGDAVTAELARAGYGDLRSSHGYVFQHLIESPKTIGALAELMEITQQGASKVVGELEELGYVERAVDAGDARVRVVRLSPRGLEAVEKTRKIRAALQKKLEKKHGAREIGETRELLAGVLTSLGGAEAVKRRRVVGPR